MAGCLPDFGGPMLFADCEGSRMAGCLPDFGGPMFFAGCHADFHKTERVLCYLLGDLKVAIGCLCHSARDAGDASWSKKHWHLCRGVAADASKRVALQQAVEAKEPATSVQKPVVAKDLAPKDKLKMERTIIQRRVMNFKAHQERFQREREESFATTMAKAVWDAELIRHIAPSWGAYVQQLEENELREPSLENGRRNAAGLGITIARSSQIDVDGNGSTVDDKYYEWVLISA
jgi:hypothetical protein